MTEEIRLNEGAAADQAPAGFHHREHPHHGCFSSVRMTCVSSCSIVPRGRAAGLCTCSDYSTKAFDFFPKEQADLFTAADRMSWHRTRCWKSEEPITTASGRRAISRPQIALRDEYGEATHLLGISIDITERRRAAGPSYHQPLPIGPLSMAQIT